MRHAYLLAFAICGASAMLETTFANSIWTQKHCGVPSSVHFVSATHALLVDQNGYCLLNFQTNDLEFVRSEAVDQTALTPAKHLLTYNRQKARVQVIDPLSDTIIKSHPIIPKGGDTVALSVNGIYVGKDSHIHWEKKESNEEKDLEIAGQKIVKIEISADKENLDVWTHKISDEKSEICHFSVDSGLTAATLKKCFSNQIIFEKIADLRDIFLTQNGELVQVTNNDIQIGNSKQKLSKIDHDSTNEHLRLKLTQKLTETCVKKSVGNVASVCKSDGQKISINLHTQQSISIKTNMENTDSIRDYFLSPDSRILVVTTSEDLVLFFDLASKTLILERDESLASVIEVGFVHKRFDSKEQSYLRNYEGYLKSKNIIGAWGSRVSYSIRSLGDLIGSGQESITGFFRSLAKGELRSAIGSIIDLGFDDPNNKKAIHAPKVAILFTKSGKIWTYDLDNLTLGKHVLLKTDFQATHEGSIDFTERQDKPGCWVSKLNKFELLLDCTHDENIRKKFAINADLELRVEGIETPKNTKESVTRGFNLDFKTNEIVGTKGGIETWRISIPTNQKLLRIDRIQDFKIPHTSFQIENANVLYKLVDPNNALVTAQEEKTLHIYVLNLKFGKILATFSTAKSDISLGIQTLVDDNAFIVSYFNTETLTQELLNIEIYRKRVENDFIRIIKGAFGTTEKYLPEINYSAADPEYIVMHRRFGLPVHIRKMKAFDSNVDLTSKNLLIVNDQDQIYSLPRTIVSTRRATESERTKAEEQIARPNKAKVDPVHFFKSLTLEPYKYYVPQIPTQFVTKNIRVAGLNDVWMEPSNYESTSFLIGTGKELFVTVHSPNGAFDQLPEDFNKPLLWLFLAGFIVLISVTSKIAGRKIPIQRFTQFIGL